MDEKFFIQNLKQIKVLAEECLSILDKNPKREKLVKVSRQIKESNIPGLDFKMPVRAFIKRYAAAMSGPKKFTLLIAYLTKGDVNKSIKLDEIKKYWNRMKGLLGGKINSFYSTQAKSNDWVDSQKQGEYNLRPSWDGIFKK